MKPIAFVLPDWVVDKRKELALDPCPCVYYNMLPLMKWCDIDQMCKSLVPFVGGSGIELQWTELIKELKTMYASKVLMARLTLSHILREQIFLRIASEDNLDETLHAYVFRISARGQIMSIRTAHL